MSVRIRTGLLEPTDIPGKLARPFLLLGWRPIESHCNPGRVAFSSPLFYPRIDVMPLAIECLVLWLTLPPFYEFILIELRIHDWHV